MRFRIHAPALLLMGTMVLMGVGLVALWVLALSTLTVSS